MSQKNEANLSLLPHQLQRGTKAPSSRRTGMLSAAVTRRFSTRYWLGANDVVQTSDAHASASRKMQSQGWQRRCRHHWHKQSTSLSSCSYPRHHVVVFPFAFVTFATIAFSFSFWPALADFISQRGARRSFLFTTSTSPRLYVLFLRKPEKQTIGATRCP